MSFVRKAAECIPPLVIGLFSCGPVLGQSQALCDVLLRPAFHYHTEGLLLILEDSSTTYGIQAMGSWVFDDGSSAGPSTEHMYQDTGQYQVCLTLSSTSIECASTYCRAVTVPLDDCGGALDARFIWQRAGLNTAMITDASIIAFSGTRLWEFGDGSTSDEIAPEHTWSLPGPHFVTLTRTQGECTATYGEWVEVDGNASTCGQGLFVDFTTTMSDQQALFDPSIGVTNVVPVIPIWSYGDGQVDTVAIGDHSYAAPGIYQTCLLVGALALPEMDSCFSIVCHTSEVLPSVGLAERTVAAPTVWPNPFVSHLDISLPSLSGPVTARLYDAQGRLVVQHTSVGVGTLRIGVVGLAEGLYVLEVDDGGIPHRMPLIKVRE